MYQYLSKETFIFKCKFPASGTKFQIEIISFIGIETKNSTGWKIVFSQVQGILFFILGNHELMSHIYSQFLGNWNQTIPLVVKSDHK